MSEWENIEGDFDHLLQALERAKKAIAQFEEEYRKIEKKLSNMRDKYAKLLMESYLMDIDVTAFEDFLAKPYVILPKGKGEWWLVVPRFIPLSIGWLAFQTKSFNVFIVNKFIDWIYPLPEDLKKELGLTKPKVKLYIEGDWLIVKEGDIDEIWQKYRQYLRFRKRDENKIRIKSPRSKFNLLIKLIEDGILPFKPQPVSKADLRNLEPKFTLRDYQRKAWETFLKTGWIGVFYPAGAGKTFLSMYAMTRLKGRKLVLVPSRTLIEQWYKMIREYCPPHILSEVEILTYASIHKVEGKEYTLIVFDEAHHLPANTYIKAAFLKAKYRISLSATPYREDGRHSLIFTLSGFPIGLSWRDFVRKHVIAEPEIELYIVESKAKKIQILKMLLETKASIGKTLIFCDSISMGNKIAKMINAPFVHGGTRKRLEVIESSRVIVISRVGDEGLDITKLRNILEFDFLFGSRRQELQRLGRILHSKFKGYHAILMTKQEYENYKKRLLSIYEKGFKVKVIQI